MKAAERMKIQRRSCRNARPKSGRMQFREVNLGLPRSWPSGGPALPGCKDHSASRAARWASTFRVSSRPSAKATCRGRPTSCRRQRPARHHRPGLPPGKPVRRLCIRGKKGQPVAIGYLERFVADWARGNIASAALQLAPAQRQEGRRGRLRPGRPDGARANWPSWATR